MEATALSRDHQRRGLADGVNYRRHLPWLGPESNEKHWIDQLQDIAAKMRQASSRGLVPFQAQYNRYIYLETSEFSTLKVYQQPTPYCPRTGKGITVLCKELRPLP